MNRKTREKIVMGVLIAGIFILPLIIVFLGGRDDFLLFLSTTALALVYHLYTGIIFHEGGHLLFGLLSGYRFGSFRIGSRLIYRVRGKFHFGVQVFSGVAGQCLMFLPEKEDPPFVLYHAGGFLINGFFCILYGILFFTGEGAAYRIFTLFGMLIHLMYGLVNGLPMRKYSNDGANLEKLKENPAYCKIVNDSLKINELELNGIRLKDMDPSLFETPEEIGTDGSVAVNRLLRRFDGGFYEEAADTAEKLLGYRLHPLHRLLVTQIHGIACFCIGEYERARRRGVGLQREIFRNPIEPYTDLYGIGVQLFIKENQKKAKKGISSLEKKKAFFPAKGDEILCDEIIERYLSLE